MKITKRLTERGDTIVEVLIVLAILAGALGISYATANKSLRISEAAREHSEAIQLAQAEVERMRNLAIDSDGSTAHNIFVTNSGFCVGDDNVVHDLINAYRPATEPDADPLTKYPSACRFGTDSRYHVGVVYSQPAHDQFTVTVRWDGITGTGIDNVVLIYRIHPAP